MLHIAYPNSKKFVTVTKKYIKKYNPKLVIVHSTIPVGTTRKIASFAVHSPVRGVHPKLEKGIKTFVKYFGGRDAKKAAAYFSRLGIKTQIFEKPETTELLKILDTTYYAWNVIFCKETKRICDALGLDFNEVYTIANSDYNEGYKKLKMARVTRPVLKPVNGKIGGHCLIPNCNLLKDWLTETIKMGFERIWFEPAFIRGSYIPILALDCVCVKPQQLDEAEVIETKLFPLKEWTRMILSGEITDSKSIAVTFKALPYLGITLDIPKI